LVVHEVTRIWVQKTSGLPRRPDLRRDSSQ